jgi:hypothetical protein
MRPIEHRPPEPTVQDVLESLEVASAERREQSRAVAEAAYDGRLTLPRLRVMREAGFLPYDTEGED